MWYENVVPVISKVDREIPAELRNVKNLTIRFGYFKHPEQIGTFPNVTSLDVIGWTADSFLILTKLKRLRDLKIVHFPNVATLDPLGSLTKLESLTLETLPSWYGKSKHVDSFHPLATLAKLNSLVLRNIVADDGTLAPLKNLSKLKTLHVSNLFSQVELATLSGSLPRVKKEWFLQPFVEMRGSPCRKCKRELVMLSGNDVRPKVVCPNCHEKKFKATVTRFESIRDAVL